jgi:hypothetical protein
VGLDFACKTYISEVLPYRRDSGIELVEWLTNEFAT